MNYWSLFGLRVPHGQISAIMRILIAGGFGFVGGRLGVHLAREGHQIVLGSRNVSVAPVWLPQAEVVHLNWRDTRALERSCGGADVVIQAAGMNAQECAIDPVEALAFNGLATARLFTAASKVGTNRFIYLSTAHVYASPLVGVIDENVCPKNRHPYGTSHLAGENTVLSSSKDGNIQGTVLRISNAYGAPTCPTANCWMLLVNDLCRQAVQDKQLILHTTGLQQRNFITLSALCNAIGNILTRKFQPTLKEVFNIGSDASQTVLEMAQLVQNRCYCVLGYLPPLRRVTALPHEAVQLLDYQSVKLAQSSLHVHVDHLTEIDRLLHFCQLSFIEGKMHSA